MSLGEKLGTFIALKVVIPLSNAFLDASDYVEQKTGKSLVDRMTESRERDETLKEDHTALWVAKKLAQGTAKGIIGSYSNED